MTPETGIRIAFEEEREKSVIRNTGKSRVQEAEYRRLRVGTMKVFSQVSGKMLINQR